MPRFKSTPRSILEFAPLESLQLAPPCSPTTEVSKVTEQPTDLVQTDNFTKPDTIPGLDESESALSAVQHPEPSVPNTECFGSLHAAALFAQAAVLAMGADPAFPVKSPPNPPIAPLGFNFLSIPHTNEDGQEVNKSQACGTALPVFNAMRSLTSKRSMFSHRNGFSTRRSRPRIRQKSDPKSATRFPCWLPVNSTHVQTKLRLLAESEQFNPANLPESSKLSPVPNSTSRETSIKQENSEPLQPTASLATETTQDSPVPSRGRSPITPSSPKPSLLPPSSPTQSPTAQSSTTVTPTTPSPPLPSTPGPSSQARSPTGLNIASPNNVEQLAPTVSPRPPDAENSTTIPDSPRRRLRTRSSTAKQSALGTSSSTASSSPVSTDERKKKSSGFVKCHKCHKLLRQSSMSEHLARHDNSGKYKCPTCGLTFSRSSAREKHVRIHTGEKPFKCEHCPKTYRQMAHLRDHLRSHSGERPFICRLCGFASGYKSLLRRHLRTHGVSAHPNTVTHLWFKTSGTKEEVMAVASAIGRQLESGEQLLIKVGEKELVPVDETKIELGRRQLCNQCPAGFPTFQALRSHQIGAHGAIRKYPCKFCGEFFGSTGQRRAHTKQFHPVTCRICSKSMSTLQKAELRDHMLAEHPDEMKKRPSTSPAASSNPSNKTVNGKRTGGNEESVATDRRSSPRLREKSTELTVMSWKRFCSVQAESNRLATTAGPESDSSVTDSDSDQSSSHSETVSDPPPPPPPMTNDQLACTQTKIPADPSPEC